MSVYTTIAQGQTAPKLTLGNIGGGGIPLRGKMRMFRMGQRLLSTYEYDTLDIAQIGGRGGNKHIVVNEIERFFDRAGKGKAGATVTDPRMTSSAVVFIPMDDDEEMPRRYFTRSYTDDAVYKIEGGYRSWGAQNIEQESIALQFKLTQMNSDREAYFDNSRFMVSNILWEFSPDGGRGRWYQLYELPNQKVRITLPDQTQQIRLRAISNNPDEWVQAIALTPRVDFQNRYAEALHWIMPKESQVPEDYIDFDDFGYLIWPEARGTHGDVIYTLYWTPGEDFSDAVQLGRTKRNDLAPGEFELPVQYLGGWLHVFAQDIMTTLHIKKRFTKSIADCEVICTPDTATYTGYEIKPSIMVRFKLDLQVLPPEFYDIEYQDNVNVGEATVIVTGKDYYYGTPEDPGHFQITQANVQNCSLTFNPASYVYDGTVKKPSVTLKLGTFTVNPADYSVEFSNNVNAGAATAKVTGKGNMTGTRSWTFQIARAQIGAITLSHESVEYGEDWNMPTYTVAGVRGTTAVEGVDYTSKWELVESSSPVAVAEAWSNVRGMTWAEAKNYTWDNLRTSLDSVSVGEYRLTVTGIGNYQGTSYATFTVEKADISTAEFEPIEDQWFTGGEIKPEPVVLRNEMSVDGIKYDRTLVKGTDFYFSWEDNVIVGQAKVIITGMGNYKSQAQTTFNIVSRLGDCTWGSIKNVTFGELLDYNWAQVSGTWYLP